MKNKFMYMSLLSLFFISLTATSVDASENPVSHVGITLTGKNPNPPANNGNGHGNGNGNGNGHGNGNSNNSNGGHSSGLTGRLPQTGEERTNALVAFIGGLLAACAIWFIIIKNKKEKGSTKK